MTQRAFFLGMPFTDVKLSVTHSLCVERASGAEKNRRRQERRKNRVQTNIRSNSIGGEVATKSGRAKVLFFITHAWRDHNPPNTTTSLWLCGCSIKRLCYIFFFCVRSVGSHLVEKGLYLPYNLYVSVLFRRLRTTTVKESVSCWLWKVSKVVRATERAYDVCWWTRLRRFESDEAV